jgi:ATP/maltotriose-dependent transcriptional regulator MalT
MVAETETETENAAEREPEVEVVIEPAKVSVRFTVVGESEARQITRVLDALDYEPIRVADLGAGALLRFAIEQTATQVRLTERERQVLELVLRGHRNGEIANVLELSKATIKWHMHNIFAKTRTETREQLLRSVLQLD